MEIIEITGVINKVFESNKKGFCNFYLDTSCPDIVRNKFGKLTCNYLHIHCYPYLPVKLFGYQENGIFNVQSLAPIATDKELCISYLMKNCSGVGRKMAYNIVSFLGDELFCFNANDLSVILSENFKLKNRQLSDLLKYLCIICPELSELEQLLIPYDIAFNKIYDIYAKYKANAVKVLLKNPYIIGSEFFLPFHIMDKIAYKMNFPCLSEERIIGLIMHVLYNAASNGHTYVSVDSISKYVNYFSEKSAYRNSVPNLCISNALLNEKLFHVDGSRISLQHLYQAELSIVQQIKIFINVTKEWVVDDSDINNIENLLKIQYGNDQRKSFSLMRNNMISILTGGPGTGKTSTVKGFIKLFKKNSPSGKIALCAPTGRAAKRLSEATGYPAFTVHKLIDYRPFGQGEISVKDKSNPVDADFIIVDEFSMVDVELFAMLLNAIRPGTKILLVGDVNQIPSVGPGNVLRDLVNSGVVPVYRLDENFRQKYGSIYSNSIRILNGELPLPADDFIMMKSRDEKESYEILCSLFDKHYSNDNPFYMQMIEPSYKGTAGVFKMNKYMHEKITSSNTPTVKDKIIFSVTNYNDGYVNGDIGVISHIDYDSFTVWNEFENIDVPISAMNDIDLAYSYTIHKAQGSENEFVVIYIPKDVPKTLLNRNLLYTAVTRASKLAVIVYEDNSLKKAIDTYEEMVRNTNLSQLISEYIDVKRPLP